MDKALKTFRSKKTEDLKKDVVAKKLELAKEFSELKAGKSNNPKKKRELKRDIAKILTIIRETELKNLITSQEDSKEQVKEKKEKKSKK